MSNEFKLVPVEQLEFFANDLALHGVGDIESARMIEDILAEPPQPTASGAEPEVLMSVRAVLGGLNGLCYETIKFLAAPTVHGKTLELIDRAHLAPLQAEIERLKAKLAGSEKDSREQIDQVKKAYEFLMLCRQDKTDTAIDTGAMRDANEWLKVAAENLGAALSKPAGSEKDGAPC